MQRWFGRISFLFLALWGILDPIFSLYPRVPRKQTSPYGQKTGRKIAPKVMNCHGLLHYPFMWNHLFRRQLASGPRGHVPALTAPRFGRGRRHIRKPPKRTKREGKAASCRRSPSTNPTTLNTYQPPALPGDSHGRGVKTPAGSRPSRCSPWGRRLRSSDGPSRSSRSACTRNRRSDAP